MVSIIFSWNCNSHNQNSQFNKFEKNLLSTSVNDERPYIVISLYTNFTTDVSPKKLGKNDRF